MQEIVIGNRYRLEIRLSPEYCCPHCGVMSGIYAAEHHQGTIVTVTQEAHHTLCENLCDIYHSEGMWGIDKEGHTGASEMAVPYTWLIPLDD